MIKLPGGLLILSLLAASGFFCRSSDLFAESAASAGAVTLKTGGESSASVPTSVDEASVELLSRVDRAPVAAPKVPELGNKEVETTLFDVYLGDKLNGAVLADYTEEWLRISEPEELIAQLEDLKNGEKLLPLLTGTIHGQRTIREVGQVRFNLNTFSIILDLSPEFYTAQNLDLRKKILAPENKPSLQQRIGVISSGSTEGTTNTALSHRGIASYGKFFAVMDGAYVSDRPYEVNQATAGGIVGDYRGTTGLLQTPGHQFAPSLQYSGVRLETAEDLFLDQDLIRGSLFQIFLPSRSRVEFYRDGRLISTQVLDFGLREVDTSSFPQGSYDVDIVIIDSFGNTTRQRKFFTKAGFLATRSRPIYTAQVGAIRDNLDSVDKPVYQSGVRWRATDIFDLNTSVYGSEDLHIGTIETVGLYRELRFGFGYNESSEQDRGITSNLGLSILGLNLNMTHNETLKGGTVPDITQQPDEEPFDPIFNLPDRQTSLIFQDRYSNSYSVNKRIGDVNLRYVREKSSGEGTPERFSRGPYVEWIINNQAENNLIFHASMLDTDRGEINSLGLIYGYRINRDFVIGSQFQFLDRSEGDEYVFLATLGYDAKDRNEFGDRALFTSDIRERDTETGSITSVTNQANLDMTGDYAQVLGFVRDSHTDEDHNTAYGVTGISSFLMASDYSVAIAHPVNREAVFIAELESQRTKSEFEVLVNDQVVGRVISGERSVIGVTPYRTYDVRLRPVEGADLVTYDSNAKKITVFPGNVVKKTWQVEKVFILLGRIVDEYGEPVARRRIKGTKEYTVTEEDGSFQAEIGGYETLEIDSDTHSCKISFDLPDNPEYFLDIGEIECETRKPKEAV